MGRILIAAHRGLRGGNLVENTLPALEAALRAGADILETDLKRTRDGVLVLFHDLDVHRLLPALHGPVRAYTLRELKSFGLRNGIGEDSGCTVTTLEELLSALGGRCLLNLDQSEPFIGEAWELLGRYGMQEQALFKGAPGCGEALAQLADCGWQPRYVPVLRTAEDVRDFYALPPQARIPMAEVIFRREDEPVFAPDFRRELARRGVRLWINALDLGKGLDMCARHNDTLSLLGRPGEGWGWLAAQGAGVIQTDFPGELRAWLQKDGKE